MSDIFEEYKNLKSFEVEFFDETYLHRIMCKIKNIEPNRMLIVSENSKTGEIKPKVGTNLTLNVYSENGIYNSLSSVIDVQEEENTTVYAISYPSQNKVTQRREYFRANLKIPYVMSIKRGDKDDLLEGETLNICGKGICIQNSKPFLPYENINLTLNFKNKSISTDAEYVYTRTTSENGKPAFQHAFVLTTISQEDIDFIVGQCFLYQLS
ncbi:PilZ domain-containing protein [bacterium]|nr:PilZ domain-containing protein [bacterium]